jgi:hypothetical protein
LRETEDRKHDTFQRAESLLEMSKLNDGTHTYHTQKSSFRFFTLTFTCIGSPALLFEFANAILSSSDFVSSKPLSEQIPLDDEKIDIELL